MDNKTPIGLAFSIILLVPVHPSIASDPAQYRTGTVEPRARQVPSEIQGGVFADPDRYLGPLVRFLVAGGGDRFQKVKILHDWVAENIAYDAASYFSGSRSGSLSAASTLRSRRGVCHGYATLLKDMCTLAGIPCEKISGFGRGYGSAAGQAGDPGDVNHAWNAVEIQGAWYLVDVTWDAGHVENRSFRKKYRTTYLFMEPGNFVYTHLPSEPKWQLLRPPLTKDQFANLPYLRGTFFDHGMRLDKRLSRVTPAGKSVQFSIFVPADVELAAELKTPAGAELPRRALVQYESNQCRVYATFPRKGRWAVHLSSQRRGNSDTMLLAAKLEFEATSGTAKTFPKTYAAYNAMRGYLFSPLYLPLAADRRTSFRVRLHGALDPKLAIGNKPWLKLNPVVGERHVYQLTTEVPDGQRVRINAKTAAGAKSYDTVVDFTADGA
jgi:hypothetical protein